MCLNLDLTLAVAYGTGSIDDGGEYKGALRGEKPCKWLYFSFSSGYEMIFSNKRWKTGLRQVLRDISASDQKDFLPWRQERTLYLLLMLNISLNWQTNLHLSLWKFSATTSKWRFPLGFYILPVCLDFSSLKSSQSVFESRFRVWVTTFMDGVQNDYLEEKTWMKSGTSGLMLK